jgi:hypothetical protein
MFTAGKRTTTHYTARERSRLRCRFIRSGFWRGRVYPENLDGTSLNPGILTRSSASVAGTSHTLYFDLSGN